MKEESFCKNKIGENAVSFKLLSQENNIFLTLKQVILAIFFVLEREFLKDNSFILVWTVMNTGSSWYTLGVYAPLCYIRSVKAG